MTSTQPKALRLLGFGALAGVLAAAVNIVIRGAALAVLRVPVPPFPLAVGADVLFTLMSCVFGAVLFVVLRRGIADRARYVFVRVAAAVLVLSWTAPAVLAARGVIDTGELVTLLVMHAVPAVAIVGVLRLLTRKPSTVGGR